MTKEEFIEWWIKEHTYNSETGHNVVYYEHQDLYWWDDSMKAMANEVAATIERIAMDIYGRWGRAEGYDFTNEDIPWENGVKP